MSFGLKRLADVNLRAHLCGSPDDGQRPTPRKSLRIELPESEMLHCPAIASCLHWAAKREPQKGNAQKVTLSLKSDLKET